MIPTYMWSDRSFSVDTFFFLFCPLYSYEPRFLDSIANLEATLFLHLIVTLPGIHCQSLIVSSSYVLLSFLI